MSASSRRSLLLVKDLEVSYGPLTAVRKVNLEVKSGEIVSLIGANGAGKTTTLRALSGLMKYNGQIQYLADDRDPDFTELSTIAPHLLVQKGLAHSPEGRGIFGDLTVLENLELGGFSRKRSSPEDKAEIEKDLLASFDLFPRLKERIKQKAGTLSGGEQQMLAMARALMSRPRLLLLDEPSLGLAPLIVAQIFEIIRTINKRGVSVLLVEQNARLALKSSDRAYVLETGEITLSGKGSDLAKDPRVIESYLGG